MTPATALSLSLTLPLMLAVAPFSGTVCDHEETAALTIRRTAATTRRLEETIVTSPFNWGLIMPPTTQRGTKGFWKICASFGRLTFRSQYDDLNRQEDQRHEGWYQKVYFVRGVVVPAARAGCSRFSPFVAGTFP